MGARANPVLPGWVEPWAPANHPAPRGRGFCCTGGMSHRPYPNIGRAHRYATLHGRRLRVIRLAPLSGDFPKAEKQRMRQRIAALPSGAIEVSGYFSAR